MGAQSFLNLGNKIQIRQDTQPKISFKDVAGAESAKQELAETIDFLKNPEKIQKLGGHMPKGVLLVGSPGTGAGTVFASTQQSAVHYFYRRTRCRRAFAR